jgi:hypothetical protein
MASEHRAIQGRPIVAGEAAGTALVLAEGLSFAMAFAVSTGRVTDVHAGHAGQSVTGRVLVMPTGRGSSSASTALAEAVRLGTAPAAIVLREVDEILAVGALVARRLYGRTCPILVTDEADHRSIATGEMLVIGLDGTLLRAP